MRNIFILTMVLLFTVAFNGAALTANLNGNYSSNILMNNNSSNGNSIAFNGTNSNGSIRDDDPLIDPTPPDKTYDSMRSSNLDDNTYHASSDAIGVE